MTNVTVDPEFKALIPPLRPEEREGLEASLKAEGCRDALVTWNGVLLDGHNRYEICERLGIEFDVSSIDLPDREAASDWIDANQLGRRNLSPDQMHVLRGRRYNRAKKKQGGTGANQHAPQSGQSDHSAKTAETIAKETGVSERTVRRDGDLVAELEQKAPKELQAVVQGEKKLSDVKRELRRAAIKEKLEATSEKEAKAASGKYDVLVVDPPWPMKKIDRDERPNQSEFDYPTMTVDEIASLAWYPGCELPAADDCHVFLWTTQKFLPASFDILARWKCRYVCTFVWHKPGGFQPVGLPQFNCEFVLYARRGSPSFLDTKAFPTCFEAKRTGHSAKPLEFYETLRRVTAGRRLDIFNRRAIDGFDGWGNESNG